MPGKRHTRIFLLLLLCQFSVACQSPGVKTGQNQYIDTQGASLHAVQNEQLRVIMNEFNALMYEQMYTELELDQQRRIKAKAIAEAAATLKRTITELPGILSDLQLTPDEQAVFRGLAVELESEASALEEHAARGDVEALRPMLYRMNTTCNACHSLFRGPR